MIQIQHIAQERPRLVRIIREDQGMDAVDHG